MQILYKAFYRVLHHLSDVEIPVDAGDFSLIDRKAVDHLLKFPERDAFIRGLRAWIGFKQIGVPYVRPERLFGRSTNNFLKNIWWAKKAIFSFSVKPLHYMQGLGFVIFLLSMALSLFYLGYYLLHPPAGAKGITTIVLLVLGLGGIQLFSLSILGDYLGKILEETKGRPRFIRARIFKGQRTFAINLIDSSAVTVAATSTSARPIWPASSTNAATTKVSSHHLLKSSAFSDGRKQ
jgi:dolichol-phosphate mannosyltransferase